MSSRTRVIVMAVSVPIIAFALVGGLLGRVMAREDTYQHLKVFDDVVNLITNNYVEPVSADRVMRGAMHGLADSLDPDSAYLSADQVRQIESRTAPATGSVGLDLTRRYYLQVIAARDGSPAARAGLQSGDFVRAIGDQPTREMSVWEGMRLLSGAPGTKVNLTVIRGGSNADPHVIELTREALPPSAVSSRSLAAGVGYLRIAAIGPATAQQVRTQVADLTRTGATRLIVDVRRTATGSIEDGLAVARLFVARGTLAFREAKAGAREPLAAGGADGAITLPAVVLVNAGTAGAAEIFAAALAGNSRADLIGEHTIGRAAVQRLIKLPDGSGLWLSSTRYLMPDGSPLHERGLEPKVAVDEPSVDFGQAPPTNDPVLEKAIEQVAARPAA
jgi:carboxyl-terminal processing protease